LAFFFQWVFNCNPAENFLCHLTMKNYMFIICLALVYAGCSKSSNGSLPLTGPQSNNLAVGASAHDFLSGSIYSTVTIQIEYAPGMQLQQQSVNNLVSFLQTHLNKTGGITVTQLQVGSIGKSPVTINDVSSFEAKYRTVFTTGGNIGVCILAVDADYATTGVAGVAYKNTSVVVLEKTVQANSGGLGQASRVLVESTVLEHEFGHLLGLVNNGTAMVVPHEDEAHTPHCNNKNCLMYYEIENSGFMSQLFGSIPQLDANCENDLKNNSGK
jgi:hypothetical protein